MLPVCSILLIILTTICVALYFMADTATSHCDCRKYDCSCTVDVQVGNVDEEIYADLIYLPREYGLRFKLLSGNYTVFDQKISERYPPAICVVHVEKLNLEFCIHFYEMDITSINMSGCVELELKAFNVLPAKFHVHCFNFGANIFERMTAKVTDWVQFGSKIFNTSVSSEPTVL